MTSNKSYRLLTPGPVPLPEEVLQALARPVLHHRTPEFEALLSRVWQGLKPMFETTEPVMVLTSTGSGAMEAALVNTLSAGDEILVINAGKFGERWAEMAQRFGVIVQQLKVNWGEPVDLPSLQNLLSEKKNLKAVLLQAVETSTATMNPVREVTELVRQFHENALVMVDAITGLGAMELKMDEWGLDVVVAGSQKALMLPTGLSFIALSKRAWAACKQAKLARYYFDLERELKANQKGQTYFSSANSLLVALDVVLTRFQKLGLSRLQKRCAILAEATRAAGEVMGLQVFSKSPSPSVTALLVPGGIDGVKLRDHLEQTHHVTMMGGQDQLQGKILRIGHLGYITDKDMQAGFRALGESLQELGIKNVAIEPALDRLNEVLSRGPGAD